MIEPRDLCDRSIVYARAEPDDEYDTPSRDKFDPYLTDEDESDLLDEEELDEDEI